MDANTLSIAVRLRRRQTETAEVSVSITEEVLQADGEGGGRKMDVDKIIEVALQMGKLDSTHWEIEGEPEIQLHPVQKSSGKTIVQ